MALFRMSGLARPVAAIGERARYALAILAGVLSMTTAQAQSVLGWIELKPVSGGRNIQVTAHATALGKVSGAEFALSMRRRSGGNQSNTRQTGSVDLAQGESKALSSTTMNIEPGDELTLELKIKDGGVEISSSVIRAGPN